MQRLSWNEVRARAAKFADDWKGASYEKGETQSFYNDFFQVFGVKRRQFASFEEPVKKLGGKQGFIDLLWKGVLLVEHKSAGRDLTRAREQAFDYFPGLKGAELPRYVLACDFATFELIDLEAGEETRFALSDLPKHVERFAFILGVQTRVFRDQDPVNVRASEIVGRLHDALEANGYVGHDLERFLVRIVFLLFADDTGIFEPRDLFYDLLINRTREDGSDTGPLLTALFQTLNEDADQRAKNLDADLDVFPYINGDLFASNLRLPSFDTAMRTLLLEACAFDWSLISPAIFGALFQSVILPAERRAQGAHYTTERNILKVIGPLFLDDLRADFERAKALKRGRDAALAKLHDRIAGLTFFDPACGCGNFLIIAYREVRQLELDILLARREGDQLVTDISVLVRVDVGQFYGIEIGEFPARIAEVALWMMDHIMNVRVSAAFGESYVRIPLRASPHIRHADALETEWADVLPPDRCDYLFGNPPFIGAKFQSKEQREQVRRIAGLPGAGGSLDYVAAWFLKGGAYARAARARIGFVATNSITQGEQVAQLWPILFDRYGMEIAYAHRTFAWGSDARGVAHVHVVILGLTRVEEQPLSKRLFSYATVNGQATESAHAMLSPYLIDASRLANPHVTVREEARPINGAPRLKTGVQMIDKGILTFTTEEKDEFLKLEPAAAPLFREFIGGDEYINGFSRWILYLADAPHELLNLPLVRDRLTQVRAYRLSSDRPSTVALGAYPTRLGVDERLHEPFLVIPNTSSEKRDYVPIGWLEASTVASQKLRILPRAGLWDFGVLTSRMHMAWMRTVTGRMKSDYMYSVGVVYNPFPWPSASPQAQQQIEALAQGVLDVRARNPGATLAQLYDPVLMPPLLRRAHEALDRAVERLYHPVPFDSDAERAEFLMGRYEAAVLPWLINPPRRKSGRT